MKIRENPMKTNDKPMKINMKTHGNPWILSFEALFGAVPGITKTPPLRNSTPAACAGLSLSGSACSDENRGGLVIMEKRPKRKQRRRSLRRSEQPRKKNTCQFFCAFRKSTFSQRPSGKTISQLTKMFLEGYSTASFFVSC